MHFGPYASERESFKILDRALELGINFIGTANVYGGEGYWTERTFNGYVPLCL